MSLSPRTLTILVVVLAVLVWVLGTIQNNTTLFPMMLPEGMGH